MQKHQMQKHDAGETAREPRNHKTYLMVSLGQILDNTTNEQLWKENTKYLLKTLKTLSGKMAYFRRLHFLLILEKALSFIRNELGVSEW